MMRQLQEFMETGAHYDEELRRQFPLFRGRPPPGHPYPEAWAGAIKGAAKALVDIPHTTSSLSHQPQRGKHSLMRREAVKARA